MTRARDRVRERGAGSALVAAALSFACGGDQPSLSSSSQALVYGDDDRHDLYQEADSALQALAALAVGAILPAEAISRGASGSVSLRARELGQVGNLCEHEPFLDQPSAALCSAVLIADDLVLSAGHCFADDAACAQRLIVFDYYYRSPGVLEHLTQADVFSCRRVVARARRSAEQPLDYAVVQLDRRALDRRPVEPRATPAVVSEPLVVIGTPSGLPLKIDHGAHVIDTAPLVTGVFRLDSDTFEGSSGSPVLDVDGKLVGLLSRGAADYVAEADAGCLQIRRIPSTTDLVPSGGETAVYIAPVLAALCEADPTRSALCADSEPCDGGACDEAPSPCADASDCGGDAVEEDLADAGSADAAPPDATPKVRPGASCALGPSARATPSLIWPGLAALLLRRRARRGRAGGQ